MQGVTMYDRHQKRSDRNGGLLMLAAVAAFLSLIFGG
jgi:hypothetical protein